MKLRDLREHSLTVGVLNRYNHVLEGLRVHSLPWQEGAGLSRLDPALQGTKEGMACLGGPERRQPYSRGSSGCLGIKSQ